jgi:ornithine cyclodeaminase/alanine dehydrogenase-like protein (mu-crystallin family)
MEGDGRSAADEDMSGTLLIARGEVERLLTPAACIAAVEDAFRGLALGTVPAPGILGMHGDGGSFHVKAGFLGADRPYFAAKVNANFPGNAARALPTIQGAILLFDAADGTLLAAMDSMGITALRTAAASAVAAKHLARERCETLLICGCGGQAAAQLRALLCVRKPLRVWAHDQDGAKAARFAAAVGEELGIAIAPAADLAQALGAADLIVTCTTSRRHFIEHDAVRPGAFIAAVGADNEDKQEIDPRLMAKATVVTDITHQAARIGDLHHAISAGLMTERDVHAQLGEVVAGRARGRERWDETIVFDSTGTGVQDVAAAIAVHRAALAAAAGARFDFGLERRMVAHP